MAARKDMMRIIRQDAGFSAKLGFGGPATKLAAEGDDLDPQDTVTPPPDKPTSPTIARVGLLPAESAAADDVVVPSPAFRGWRREQESTSQSVVAAPSKRSAAETTCSARGRVIYVAVSLTAQQAPLAEAWAMAARCSVQFLIRRVAQGMREDLFDEWEVNGMPHVTELRGARSRHPTSVTLTLCPQVAAALSARHDPLGLIGLARAMGPAFRAHFEAAFDAALAKAGIQTTQERVDK
jgi:hypothetical protein